MAKFMVHTRIGFARCQHDDELEIPDEELAGLTLDEVTERVYEDARDISNERIESWVTLYDENDWSGGRPLKEFELIPGPGPFDEGVG